MSLDRNYLQDAASRPAMNIVHNVTIFCGASLGLALAWGMDRCNAGATKLDCWITRKERMWFDA